MKRIGVLAYDGCWSMNVSLVKDIFRIVSLLESHKGLQADYSAEILTIDGKEVISANGSVIVPDKRLDQTTSYDLIIVPAIEGVRLSQEATKYEEVIGALSTMITDRSPLLSLSTGAYFIAATGKAHNILLATHWAYVKKLNALFPNVTFANHSSYIKDQNIYSTSTLNAAIDVLLAFISQDKGERFAYECATHLLVSDPKESHPILPGYRNHKDFRVYHVQDWIETHYQGTCSIEEMAKELGFSQRNLKRRFQEATGIPPNQYLQRVRIDKAKKLLLSTSMTIKEISYEVGYESDSFFTRAFKKNTGETPSQWRKSS
jgi:transcriptional regulator GlxA family with amidase domain